MFFYYSKIILSLIISIIILCFCKEVSSQGVHQCVHVTTKLAKYGDGSTLGSCMGCDPAVPYCDLLCKPIVQKLFAQCNGICLPDGYFFDPKNTLTGCWKDNEEEIKIQVGRCGCNSSKRINCVNIFMILLISVITLFSFN